jgi:hypothetical protein
VGGDGGVVKQEEKREQSGERKLLSAKGVSERAEERKNRKIEI